jgi:hypothetical protein
MAKWWQRAPLSCPVSTPPQNIITRLRGAYAPPVIDMADLGLTALAPAKRLVFMPATWGEGEPPDVRHALSTRSRLSKLYAEDLAHEEIITTLDPVFAA